MIKELKPCPLCGSPAFVSHDIVDGFEFGWSVGCPRACIDDPVHNLNEEKFKKAKLVMFYFPTKQEAVQGWNRRVEEGEG